MKVHCNGVPYHVKVVGEGEPVLLLHGFSGNHETWNCYVNHLSEGNTCIAPDLLGHGKTACPVEPSRYQIDRAGRDLKIILDTLKIEKAHVIGYSMGGRLAISFALNHPQYIKSLTLESTSPGLQTAEERNARKKQDYTLAERIMEQGIAAFVDYWEDIPLFQSQKWLPMEAKTVIRKQRLQNSELGLANSLKGMGTGSQPSYWGRLHELTVPVLLLTGEYDEKFCRIAEEMNHRLPCSDWLVVEKCGHAIHVEDYELFGKIVSEFVENGREKKNGY